MERTKKRALPSRELQIVARLKEAREFLRLTQPEVADQIGIGRARLASYEEGRAPLRWEVALRICHQFFIGECWLATGREFSDIKEGSIPFANTLYPRYTAHLLASPVTRNLKPGQLFSAAFDECLGKEWDRHFMENFGCIPLSVLKDDSVQYLQNSILYFTEQWKGLMPEGLWHRFFIAILKSGMLLNHEFSRLVDAQGEPLEDNPSTRMEKIIDVEVERVLKELDERNKRLRTQIKSDKKRERTK